MTPIWLTRDCKILFGGCQNACFDKEGILRQNNVRSRLFLANTTLYPRRGVKDIDALNLNNVTENEDYEAMRSLCQDVDHHLLDGNVLAACVRGSNRTSIFAVAFTMWKSGCSLVRAESYMNALRAVFDCRGPPPGGKIDTYHFLQGFHKWLQDGNLADIRQQPPVTVRSIEFAKGLEKKKTYEPGTGIGCTVSDQLPAAPLPNKTKHIQTNPGQ